jgi:outer membrane lipoprotein LolB
VEALSDQRKENHSGRFELTQRQQDTVLDLFSPLGPLLARLSVRESGATLELADRGTFTALNAEMLLSNVIGWSVPVEALPKWLSAGPNDLTLKATGQMAEFDPTNRLQTARSGTWRADIIAHSVENKPSRLQIQGTTQDGSQRVNLRLVLDSPQSP